MYVKNIPVKFLEDINQSINHPKKKKNNNNNNNKNKISSVRRLRSVPDLKFIAASRPDEVSCKCEVLTPFGRRHPMHIWLIRVSSNNLDTTVASYKLSCRIHRTAAAEAHSVHNIRPDRLLDYGSTEGGLNHAVDGNDANDVELFDAVSKVACVPTMAAGCSCTHQLVLLYGSPASLAARTGSVPFDNADRPAGPRQLSEISRRRVTPACAQFQPASQPSAIGFPGNTTSSSNVGLPASESPESVDVRAAGRPQTLFRPPPPQTSAAE